MSNGGSYNPHAVESEICQFWEAGGYFRARPKPDKEPYVIDIPLPNVTGALHLGHAINDTLQDILIRYKRMCGYEALWMPGTDHAGIATQAVVERRLKEDQNLTRHELGREGLVRKIWEWKEEYEQRILMQLRKMGFSCDWDRTRFTLDEVCGKAVYEVFFRWFKEGLIYRGLRLVNWDSHLQTAVADDEVFHETLRGHLWHYRYPILTDAEFERVARFAPRVEESQDRQLVMIRNLPRRVPDGIAKAALGRATAQHAKVGRDYLSIATTRPETMLGDTAVAVHPDDARYKHLIGRRVLLPLQNDALPVIADDILVQADFGTGCVKVTPGHDPNDYECGLRNNLTMINILTPDGKINDQGADYAGMDLYAARDKVVEDLEALGLMEKVEPYEHEVGHSDRSKTPIEPMLSEQWFMKMGDLAETVMEAVRDGRVEFFPARYAKTLLDWVGEKRDWCISRQLWWGHRIPVWRSGLGEKKAHVPPEFAATLTRWGETDRVSFTPAERRMLHAGAATLPSNICVHDLSDREVVDALEGAGYGQDPDVLDTWFSSSLWPFSTLGWPHDRSRDRERAARTQPRAAPHGGPVADAPGSDQNWPTREDLEYFYPTSTLVTGREIITLWVARMIMTGLYFMGRVPFQHVYIHPNIQDGQGRRMSKSLGNGVDPLDIIDLYGTDALRYTMAQIATETQDVRLPVKQTRLPDGREVNTSDRFEPGRNFCNKLWQAATGFILPNLEATEPRSHGATKDGAGAEPSSAVPPWPASPPHAPDSEVRHYFDPRPLGPEELAIEDRWILSRLGGCIAEVDRRFARYQLNEVVNTLRAFFWDEFCDWYVELVKPRLFSKDASGKVTSRTDRSAAVARQVLVGVLDQTLRLLHPVVPFITEKLWRQLGEKAPQRGLSEVRDAEPALITAAWPDAEAQAREPEVEREMAALQDVIRALRDALVRINASRSAAKAPAIGKIPRAVIRADEHIAAGLQQQLAVLQRLGRCEAVEIGTDLAKPPASATQVLTGVEVYVPLSGLMNLDAERKRLQKERDTHRGHIERLTGKLANEGFVSKAPPAVVEQERLRLAEMKSRLATLERNLADLGT